MTNEISKSSNVLTITALAATVAVIFDYLFFEKIVGLSVLLFAVIIVGILLSLSVKFKYSYKSGLWLALPILFFALMPVIRANLFLSALNILAISGLLLLTTQELLQNYIRQFRIFDYFKTVVLVPLNVAVGAFRPIIFGINRFRSSSAGWRRVLIGVVMALPVLIVFTMLFSSADLAFNQVIKSVVNFQVPDEFFAHVFILLFIFAGSLGAMEYIFKPTESKAIVYETKPISDTAGREVETQVFLYMIAALFLVFIIFQITYLFGGETNIINKGFTYAEYARRGFWELLAVAFFTLGILLSADRYTVRRVSRKKWFTIPSGIIILEILVIIVSAFKRLMLYQDAYGMTLLRFYVATFIIFLCVIFILLAIKLFYEKKENFFTFASLLTFITFLFFVNFMNPDAFIARKNIANFRETGKIDVIYLSNLSADALPQVLEIYPRLSEEDKLVVDEALNVQRKELEEYRTHWQSYNYSRSKALYLLQKP